MKLNQFFALHFFANGLYPWPQLKYNQIYRDKRKKFTKGNNSKSVRVMPPYQRDLLYKVYECYEIAAKIING